MIGKATTGQSFTGLGRYLGFGSLKEPVNKVDWFYSKNFSDNSLNIQECSKLMFLTSKENKKTKKPVYHLSISWDKKDKVNRDIMNITAGDLMKTLGLSDNQYMVVSHNDTDHKHIHIVANRVNHNTLKSVTMSHDYAKIEKKLRELEKKYNLREVKGKNYALDGEYSKNNSREKEFKDLIRKNNLSFRELATEISDPIFKNSKNWKDLKQNLKERGLYLEKKGRGMVLTDGSNYIKCSDINRGFSLLNLEKKLGKYEQNIKRESGRSNTELYKTGNRKTLKETHGRINDNTQRKFKDSKRDERELKESKNKIQTEYNNNFNNDNFFNPSRYHNKQNFSMNKFSKENLEYKYLKIDKEIYQNSEKIDKFNKRLDWHKKLEQGAKLELKESFTNPEEAFKNYKELKSKYGTKKANEILLKKAKKIGELQGKSFFGIKSPKRYRALKNLKQFEYRKDLRVYDRETKRVTWHKQPNAVLHRYNEHGKEFVKNPINIKETKNKVFTLKKQQKEISRELKYRENKRNRSVSYTNEKENDFER